MLFKKMYRDIIQNIAQFIAIFLMVAAGIVVFSGINSVTLAFENNVGAFLKECNQPELWFNINSFSDTEFSDICDIDGIKEIDKRAVRIAAYDNKSLTIISSDKNIISIPHLIDGEPFDNNSDGIWLSDIFMQRNNYELNQTLTINNKQLVIKGRILSSEYVYTPSSSLSRSGYAYMSQQAAQELFGYYEYNNFVLTVDKNFDKIEIQNKIINMLGRNYRSHMNSDSHLTTLQINDKISIFNKFSYIFPVLFFLLAALTMLTTMTRMIENQRVQIGTLRALGFGKNKIRFHYISYGLWIGLLGGVFGLFLGRLIIPPILIPLLKVYFKIPYWSVPISLPAVVSIGIIALCCVFAVLLALGKKFKAKPAVILKGSEIKKGRHSIFEKITPLWSRLSFETKITLRNISQNKIKTVMAFIGVTGCMMLILSGLGMRNSLDYTVDSIYSDLYRYENRIVLRNPTGYSDSEQDVQYLMYIDSSCKLVFNEESSGVEVSVLEDGRFVKFNEGLTINHEGLIISKAFADSRGIKLNDEVVLEISAQQKIQAKVAEITVIPIMKHVYLSEALWTSCGFKFFPNVIFTGTLDDKDELLESLSDYSIINKEDELNQMKDSVKSVDAVMYIMLVGAIFLGMTVLINLALLSFTEMKRQYATLKVIGFSAKELQKMAFKENAIVTFLGWLAGFPLGIWFLDFYMKILSSDTNVFFSYIKPLSFFIATALTLVCSLFVNFLLTRKIKKIDMVKLLKINE